jgi:hypothetical protein
LGAPINGLALWEQEDNTQRGSKNFITFDTKETILELNGCHIEAYPTYHIDAFRVLDSPMFILLEKADFL